nr:MAG TPA: hypothetical protein [Caudoviricetes sp.]
MQGYYCNAFYLLFNGFQLNYSNFTVYGCKVDSRLFYAIN